MKRSRIHPESPRQRKHCQGVAALGMNGLMAERGVIMMASGRDTLQEEIPEAYKNLDDVVEVVHRAGLSRKVAKLRTLGCIKG